MSALELLRDIQRDQQRKIHQLTLDRMLLMQQIRSVISTPAIRQDYPGVCQALQHTLERLDAQDQAAVGMSG